VRVQEGELLWFVRDLGPAIGFRPPLTVGSAVPRVLVATQGLWPLMEAVGYRPPEPFTAWAEDLARRLTRSPAPRLLTR
jgi:hypothetical protein